MTSLIGRSEYKTECKMRTTYKDEMTHYQPIYGFAFFYNQVARRYSHWICVHDLFINYRTVSCTILTQGITKANVKQCMYVCMYVLCMICVHVYSMACVYVCACVRPCMCVSMYVYACYICMVCSYGIPWYGMYVCMCMYVWYVYMVCIYGMYSRVGHGMIWYSMYVCMCICMLYMYGVYV